MFFFPLKKKTSLEVPETISAELPWQQAGNFHKTKLPRGQQSWSECTLQSHGDGHALCLNTTDKEEDENEAQVCFENNTS